MKNGEILQSAESAAPQSRCQPRPFERILVVDDDELILRLNIAVLSCFGYQTESAEDGAAAWNALRANDYDLLITDNNMPRVSGVELVKKVRSARMTLPVILASGDLPTRELDRNPWLQPVATLAKPFTSEELLGVVRKVLSESAMTRDQTEAQPIYSQGNFGLQAQGISNHGCV